jgi:GNAT superfamily N-acetyltransferase
VSAVTVSTLQDRDARKAALGDLARLRIAVFRDWPYLYEGSLDYERDYLAGFESEHGSVLVVAHDGGAIVGMATASPMAAQKPAMRDPMIVAGHDPAALFYFGESVLLPGYRGQGIGHAFFDHREAAARQAGATSACFCAVIRPPDHPLRPAHARDLAPFWHARGYAPVEGALAEFDWQDIDQQHETAHPMQFWARSL